MGTDSLGRARNMCWLLHMSSEIVGSNRSPQRNPMLDRDGAAALNGRPSPVTGFLRSREAASEHTELRTLGLGWSGALAALPWFCVTVAFVPCWALNCGAPPVD